MVNRKSQFILTLRRFVPPYRLYIGLNILFNLLSTIFSLFSFAAIIPVLRILFGLTVSEVKWVKYDEMEEFRLKYAKDPLKTDNITFPNIHEWLRIHGYLQNH